MPESDYDCDANGNSCATRHANGYRYGPRGDADADNHTHSSFTNKHADEHVKQPNDAAHYHRDRSAWAELGGKQCFSLPQPVPLFASRARYARAARSFALRLRS